MLSTEQRTAHDLALAFLRDPNPPRPYWLISGLAGTGKTETLATLARAVPTSTLCAFTGKAASVLRARTGLRVSTIHSFLYDRTGEERDARGRKQPTFKSKLLNHAGLVIFVDESSTVGEKLGTDLIKTGAKIIACGDPGQLPPINDVPFFGEADVTLTEVHRQAWESPIIRQAHAVRSGGSYRADGDAFRVVVRAEMTADDISFGDIALCHRNETRRRLNASRRRALGITGLTLRRGEPVMTLRNDRSLGVYNGTVCVVDRDREPGDDLVVVDDSGRRVNILNTSCEMIDTDFEQRRYDQDFMPVTLAYACTTHKAQGSGWRDVLFIDEYPADDQRTAFVYTALTRAAERILVVTP